MSGFSKQMAQVEVCLGEVARPVGCNAIATRNAGEPASKKQPQSADRSRQGRNLIGFPDCGWLRWDASGKLSSIPTRLPELGNQQRLRFPRSIGDFRHRFLGRNTTACHELPLLSLRTQRRASGKLRSSESERIAQDADATRGFRRSTCSLCKACQVHRVRSTREGQGPPELQRIGSEGASPSR